jgi:tetratricopeptide (TPR) repeat protein
MAEQRQAEHHPQPEGIAPPPRLLLWAVIGLFLLAIVGTVGGIVVFRSVLVPGQQQRIIDQIPFMRAFLPPTPEGGTLPTAAPVEGGITADDLLGGPLGVPTATEAEPTEAAAAIETEPTATITPSPLPTHTPTATLTPVPATEVAAQPTAAQTVNISQSVQVPVLPASARMFGFSYFKQEWNNCGPANLTMALSYYGWTRDQSFAKERLKPDREDKNVSPHELVAFVNEQTQLRAITRMGGDLQLLKAFIAAQIPVIIETGYMPEGSDWLGHYQTVVAYDDLVDNFYVYDSWLGNGASGEGLAESFESVNRNWHHFNRTFIAIYEPNRETEVRAILGERADPTRAAELALETARAEARANPRDSFAWFNIGTSFTRLGQYEEAAAAYDQSRREGSLPWRMTWYQFGPFEAYFNAGRYDDVMALVEVNLTNGAQYVEETHYWQGRVFEMRGNVAGARGAFSRALQHNYLYEDARTALDALNA